VVSVAELGQCSPLLFLWLSLNPHVLGRRSCRSHVNNSYCVTTHAECAHRHAKMFREPGQRVKIERSAKLAGIGIPDIIEMGIGAPISFLMDDDDSPILRSVGGSLSKYKYVDIVVTLPPGWQHHEHEMFEQSINRALGQREGQRVWLASETECVLREWMQMERPETFSEGDVIIVVDVGAGTAVCNLLTYPSTSLLVLASCPPLPPIRYFTVSTLRTLNTILADSPRRLHLN
jgi:hypothetical protein